MIAGTASWQFIRIYAARTVISTVLVAAVFWAISVYSIYQREQRIALRIKSLGGEVGVEHCGADWIPMAFQEGTQFLLRIEWVDFSDSNIPEDILLLDFGFLTNLKSLYLKKTRITDRLINLRGVTSLEELFLSDTQITSAGMNHLHELKNLKTLSLNGTQITDDGLEHLRGLFRLQELFLNNTQITSTGLGHLKRLMKLSLLSVISTQVTDAGLEHLHGLMGLKELYLIDTQTSADGIAKLQTALPNCKIYSDH